MISGKSTTSGNMRGLCVVSLAVLLLVRDGVSFNQGYLRTPAASRNEPCHKFPITCKTCRRGALSPLKMSSDAKEAGESQTKFSRTRIILSTTFNLVKAIAGSGILALPSGIAATSDFKTRLVPALALMVGLGALSAYTFWLYGRLLDVHQSQSLGELWNQEKGSKSSWMVSLATMTFCFGAALSYSILLGDTFEALAHTFGLRGILLTRPFWILLLTSTILYPLCNLESLLALAPLSVGGVAAVATTACFLGWRCPHFNPLSPYSSSGGALIGTLSSTMAPSFNTYQKPLLSPASTILVGMAASAYLGHFSAPSFYNSLKATNSSMAVPASSQGIENYKIVTRLGFAVAVLLNCLVMAFGFLTFGGASSGMILNNFSFRDRGASVCRMLMAVCVLGGYPFLVSAVVGEFLQLRPKQKMGQPSGDTRRVTTFYTLLLLTGMSLFMKDAGFVIGFSGAVMGSFIVYIFPSLLFLSHSKKKLLPDSSSERRTHAWERVLCRILVGFGAVVSVLGGCVSVARTYFPNWLR